MRIGCRLGRKPVSESPFIKNLLAGEKPVSLARLGAVSWGQSIRERGPHLHTSQARSSFLGSENQGERVSPPHSSQVRSSFLGAGRQGENVNQSIKCIYKALRTSADVSKCCTETQPKTPKQQAMQV